MEHNGMQKRTEGSPRFLNSTGRLNRKGPKVDGIAM